MAINVRVIGSDSAGNCTAVWAPGGALLVDCGLPVNRTVKNLDESRIRLSGISGVLMTHTHGDHIKAPLLKRLLGAGVPVFCHFDIVSRITEKFGILERSHIRAFGRERFGAGYFEVEAFEVDHDSDRCYGYILRGGGRKITIATDLGPPGEHLVEKFAGSDVIVIESNHDLQMLESSSRPAWLKRRIRSSHLSNAACAGFLRSVMQASGSPPSAIILAHLSRQCNTPVKAAAAVRDALGSLGMGGIPLYISGGSLPSETVVF